jgi:hypothetical protein
MNPTNCRDRPAMSEAQVIPCTLLGVFRQSMLTVRSESNVCIVACVSNFLTDSTDTSSSVSTRISPVLKDFFDIIVAACSEHQERRYLVCPPMYRKWPLWYRDGLPEVLHSFSDQFARSSLSVTNLSAMPGFPNPSLESDGIHLTPYSGLEYVLHLFDRAKMLLATSSLPSERREPILCESNRLLSDQVIALQQDHQRLSTAFDLKSAIDAELDCFRENERNEDSILISGLPRLAAGLSGKEWQDRARKSVEDVLRLVVSSPVRVLVVHNATGRGSEALVTYTCQLESVDRSREVRRLFGRFFTGGKDSRPRELSEVSISNVVTKETRVRIAIMKVLGKKYLTSNPGAKVQVIGYQPRPILRLTPPQGASDRRPKSFNFIQSVQKLSKTLVDSELSEIAKRASAQFPGRLKELFVILNDDMAPRGRSRPGKRGPETALEGEPSRQRQDEDASS